MYNAIRKTLAFGAALALSASVLAGCAGGDSKTGTAAGATSGASAFASAAAEGGVVSIDTTQLTKKPLFVNYDSNGTTVQLIGVVASDGTPRLSFNTCQSCNPSPKAYFTEKNGKLECQNCGNVFTMDSVGVSSRGCNPMIATYELADGKMVIDAAYLDTYADKFASWAGPTK